MNALIARTLALAVLFQLGNTHAYAQPWQLYRDEEGIRVYLRDLPDSAIKQFRSVTRIHASLDSLLAVMDDTDACPDWVHNCAQPLMLHQVRFVERYNFQVSKMPWFVTDRGLIFHTAINQDPVSKVVTMQMNANPDFCETRHTAGCDHIRSLDLVMITRSSGFYRFTPLADNWTEVIWQQHTEPAGNLPAWLINGLLIDIPFYTLSKLRDIVQKPVYQQQRLIYGTDGIATGFESRSP